MKYFSHESIYFFKFGKLFWVIILVDVILL